MCVFLWLCVCVCIAACFADQIQQLCQANPTARIPSPDSCSHYFDCTASTSPGRTQADQKGEPQFVEYLMECPYPQLFSPARGQCQHHSYVTCRDKFEPKAPCKYNSNGSSGLLLAKRVC